jgi:hypothetical protein
MNEETLRARVLELVVKVYGTDMEHDVASLSYDDLWGLYVHLRRILGD